MPEQLTYEALEQRVKELEASESKTHKILEALQQKEYLYDNLFKNMLHEVHVWKLVLDDFDKIKTWKLVDANPAALKSWNKSLSDVIGKTPDEMFPGSDATEQFMPVVEKIFTEGKPHIWESHFPDSNQFLHMVSIPLGEYFISTGLDITERRQAGKALRQKHEMLKCTEAIANIVADRKPLF
ncbi:PAS domain-containing protein [Desulfotignum phosphitoxidans]|uniref:Putative hybrid histidine kinase n=1 Tax=Desulfotignum phosphitoxidans DSM 13687 TaxID=1286635 RepID=S0G5F0_9BACT|nr:PAS domain-containing protein [Desulfotignum phosphitoxidans]EMS79687.1 putative hybrid histidine kinase [Desulfotignum phosphitoxidans DSM 13687]